MKKNVVKRALALCLAALLAVSMLGTSAFAAASGAIANASFEEGLAGWTLSQDTTPGAVYLTGEARTGAKALTCWSMNPYTAGVSQTVTGLAPGWYTLTAAVQSSGYQEVAYLYANGTSQSKCMTAIPSTNSQNEDSKGWNTVTVRGIQVGTDGIMDIGLYTKASGRQFVNLDDIQLTKEARAPRPFLLGGDVSQLNYVEDCGAKFYDKDGKEVDALQSLAESGWNFARIRLYNHPGKGHGDGYYYCKGEYMNVEDTLDLARRCKDKGMAIEYSFHYSDYWTNGGTQIIPLDWQEEIRGMSDKDAVKKLEELVYTYTKDIMQQLKDQGTAPEYVSLGNEIQGGMLYPYGKAARETWPNLAKFFNAGYKAVKEVAPDSQIVIHLDGCGDTSKYTTFFDAMKANNVNYDIIGASYYPYFARCSVNQVTSFCNELIDRYDRDIMIMETGYNWNATRPDGWTGQLVDNGNYTGVYNSTPDGQKIFLIDLFNAMKNVKDGRCIGDLYWDPIFVEQPGVGWAMQESDDTVGYNIVSNTTLFDFQHKALASHDAYFYNRAGTALAAISGKVVADDNGAPLAGQKATLTVGGESFTVTTDACGQFYVNVPAGTAAISLAADGLTLTAGSETVTLEPGKVFYKTFAVNGGTISGKVTIPEGWPVYSAVVAARGGVVEASATVDPITGVYTLADLPAGSYTISVTARGYEVTSPAVTVDVAVGESKTGVDFSAVLVSGILTGIVADPAGNPLANVTVTAGGSQAVTDAEGKYTLYYVPAGESVTVEASAWSWSAASVQTSLAAGECKMLDPILLTKATGSLTGTVISAGSPVPGARITLSDVNGLYYSVLTGADGRFTLSDVLVSSYNATVTKEGFIPRSVPGAEVRLGQVTDLGVVTMPQLVTIQNPGFEEQGSAFEIPKGWNVTTTSNSTNGKAATRQDRSYFGGAYEGTYGLSFWLDDRFTADVNQTVTGLTPGRYIFSAATYSGIETVSGTLTMYAKDAAGQVLGETKIMTSGSYKQTSVEFDLTGTAVTIGFSVDAAGGDWAVIDAVQLGQISAAQTGAITGSLGWQFDGETVRVTGDAPENSTLVLAAYDSRSQVAALTTDLSQGVRAGSDWASCKLFLLDDHQAPLCAAAQVDIG